MVKRCPWAETGDLERDYHDAEWGVPLLDDRKLFEFLVLEGMQAGLSWSLILQKRDALRDAFHDFEPEEVAGISSERIETLLGDKRLIRNHKKVEAVVKNAKTYLQVCEEFDGFSDYIWSFTDGADLVNACETMDDVPAQTDLSRRMSKEMKKRGFVFMGPVTCYAFMQAVGMVNDHLVDCFRYEQLQSLAKEADLPTVQHVDKVQANRE